MPSQRRTLPAPTPPTDPTVTASPSGPAPTPTTSTAATGSRKGTKLCAACGSWVPSGALVAGVCPPCAGMVPLPLRDARGRYLPSTLPACARGAR